MLDTVFYFILNMSVASCFVIVALLLIRQIRPLPRRIAYPLWALAFFRLIMPFTLQTNWSLFNFTGELVKRLITVKTVTQGTVAIPEPGGAVPIPKPDGLVMSNFFGAADFGGSGQYAPIEYKTESLRQIFSTAAVIWIIVAAAMLLTAVILYTLTRKELKKAVHIKDNLYRSDMLLSPVLTGLFRPKIILPVSLDPDGTEGRMILAHENIHRRRLDNLWRLVAIFVTCLHWFNPFAWITLKAFSTDMELSCDATVVRKYKDGERKAYAEALLCFAEDKRLLVSTAFGRAGVKVRIVNVLNYRKLTLIGVAASSLFLLVIAVVLITNPQLRG
jgi:beta-lactamase regulating signal transducer with metallopeptidase domain